MRLHITTAPHTGAEHEHTTHRAHACMYYKVCLIGVAYAAAIKGRRVPLGSACVIVVVVVVVDIYLTGIRLHVYMNRKNGPKYRCPANMINNVLEFCQ